MTNTTGIIGIIIITINIMNTTIIIMNGTIIIMNGTIIITNATIIITNATIIITNTTTIIITIVTIIASGTFITIIAAVETFYSGGVMGMGDIITASISMTNKFRVPCSKSCGILLKVDAA
jgi:hypothetical protein